jgi:hypothetical protein
MERKKGQELGFVMKSHSWGQGVEMVSRREKDQRGILREGSGDTKNR